MESFDEEFFTCPLIWNLSPDQYDTLRKYLTLSISTTKFPPKDRLPQTKKEVDNETMVRIIHWNDVIKFHNRYDTQINIWKSVDLYSIFNSSTRKINALNVPRSYKIPNALNTIIVI